MKILHMADGQLGKPTPLIAEVETWTLVRQTRIEALGNVVRAATDGAVGRCS